MYRAKVTPKTAASSHARSARSSPAATHLGPFSVADHEEKHIPSMVDGLTPAQRKVLFCSFKRNLVKDANVARFAAYVMEHSAYRHGDRSLASMIMAMAQDFVGSNNNINLLEPRGQFGSRNLGGKDAADACHIYTRLPPITRLIFPKDDDAFLNYLNEDGLSIEPSWYMPVIPMVLVNGGEAIKDAGLTSYVPNYNPRDIIANLKRLLNDEYVVPMEPWYKGFKGSLKETSSNADGVTYTISGVIEQVGDTKLKITELPVRRWTVDYKDFLESLCPIPRKYNGKVNSEEPPPFVEEIRSRCNNTSVEFEVILTESNMKMAKQEGLDKKFKLTTTIGTTNMYLLDSYGKVRKYDTPENILTEFFELRLEYYYRRKEVMMENIGEELLKVKNKVRFIRSVISGDIVVVNRTMGELILELKKKHYYNPFPKKNITGEPVAVGATEENDGSHVEAAAGVDASDYEYLLEMAICTMTQEKAQELIAQEDKLHEELKSLEESDAKLLWLRDLDALEKELDVLDAKLEAEQEQRRRWRERKVAKAAPKRQPNPKTAAKSQ